MRLGLDLPPSIMEFGYIYGCIIGSMACDISIKVNDEVEAGSEFLASIHADPEHVLSE